MRSAIARYPSRHRRGGRPPEYTRRAPSWLLSPPARSLPDPPPAPAPPPPGGGGGGGGSPPTAIPPPFRRNPLSRRERVRVRVPAPSPSLGTPRLQHHRCSPEDAPHPERSPKRVVEISASRSWRSWQNRRQSHGWPNSEVRLEKDFPVRDQERSLAFPARGRKNRTSSSRATASRRAC